MLSLSADQSPTTVIGQGSPGKDSNSSRTGLYLRKQVESYKTGDIDEDRYFNLSRQLQESLQKGDVARAAVFGCRGAKRGGRDGGEEEKGFQQHDQQKRL
jgi:hypothetical protein